MHLRRFVTLACLGAALTLGQPSLAQVAFGQDDGADQAPADQAPADQAPPDQAASPDQSPPDQPSVAADDAHWWLKRGGPRDSATLVPLQHYYEQFWFLRSEAFAQLDTIFLPEVMFGGALASDTDAVHQLEAQGKAQILVVEIHDQIWYTSPDEAVIYDPYVSRSYFVDAKTHKPLGDGPNTAPSTVSMAFHLTQHPGHFGDVIWMVDNIKAIDPQ